MILKITCVQTVSDTYIPLSLIPEGVADASQIFLRDTQIIPKFIAMLYFMWCPGPNKRITPLFLPWI
jgi:hypothetical protein